MNAYMLVQDVTIRKDLLGKKMCIQHNAGTTDIWTSIWRLPSGEMLHFDTHHTSKALFIEIPNWMDLIGYQMRVKVSW